MRLIDADNFECFLFHIDSNGIEDAAIYEMGFSDGVQHVLERIDEEPTVDAVMPIVRCRDCNAAELAGTRIYCLIHGTYFNDNDFCSYGERDEYEDDGTHSEFRD